MATQAQSTSSKDAMRTGLGMSLDWRVGFVIYDKIADHAFSRLIGQVASQYDKLIVFPLDQRAQRHLSTFYALYLKELGALVVDTIDARIAADDMIMFRFIEDIAVGSTIPIRAIDPNGRWLTAELAAS